MTDEALVSGVLSAIKNDDDVALQSFVDKGVPKDIPLPPELPDEPEVMRNGAPLICAAAFYGAIKCIKYLVSTGADKSEADDDGMAIAFYASAGGKPEVVDVLVEMDFDMTGCGQAAIRFGNTDMFEALLAKGVIGVEDKDFCDSTFMHIAAFYGNVEVTKYLAGKKKIRPDAVDREGRTPLHLAAGNGFVSICETLMRYGCDPLKMDKFQKAPLHYAVVQQNYDVLELFLGGPTNGLGSDDLTPLMRSAVEGRFTIVKLLLELDDVDPNMKNAAGSTALVLAIHAKQDEAINTLLSCDKVDVNIADGDGNTPLHMAVRKKLMDIVATLLKKGADIHAKNSAGKTAMQDLSEKIARPPKPPGD